MSAFRFWLYLFVSVGLMSGGLSPKAVAQIDEVPRPDRAHGASFGVSVSQEDSLAAVGASGEPECGSNSGAVYVFEREPGPTLDAWEATARVTPDTCQSNAFFGQQVVLSGRRLFVSASSSEPLADEGANEAYMFRRSRSGEWRQTARFTGPPGHLEGSFAADIDLDGERAVVSTSGRPDGERGGAVYVYEYDSSAGTWESVARLTASRGIRAGILGGGIALSGNHLAVAASTYFDEKPGSVYVFERDSVEEVWREAALLRGIESFFIELDLHGSRLLVGEDRAFDDRSGRATVYTRQDDGDWQQTTNLRPSVPYASGAFGTTVALNDRWALVSGYGEQLNKDFNIDRVVYAFRRGREDEWSQHTTLDVGEVGFGAALDLHRSVALVSSVPSGRPGSAYIVHLP